MNKNTPKYRKIVRDIWEKSNIDPAWFDTEYLSSKDDPWAYISLLAPYRAGLIYAMELDSASNVLVLGGTSPMLSALSAKCANVTCIEDDYLTSKLLRVRNRDVNTLCAPFMQIPDGSLYDAVIWADGCEYYEDNIDKSLEEIKSALKEGGKLYLACKNPFGIRYYDGDSEHASHPGYSKPLLRDMVSKAGFSNILFYYPYPDHMMPSEIYSDEHLPDSSIGSDIYRNIYPRVETFDVKSRLKTIISQGMFDSFCNSYLVEATR